MTARSLAAARTFLFVPADRPERYAKAFATAADMVIVDLEDAVAGSAKEGARGLLHAAWQEFGQAHRRRLVVRINPRESRWHAADVALLESWATQGLAGIMVPKADGRAALGELAAACPGVALLPLVETAAAFGALDEIAGANSVARLCLGDIDLQADLHMEAGGDGLELAAARWSMALASRRAGLALPVDGITPALDKPERLVADTHRAMRAGFGAKLCIHPCQIDVVHTAFAPSAEKVAWALAVMNQARADTGAQRVDGKMVDAPVVRLAEQILARRSA